MKYYKALLFGSIGSIVETSEIQRKSFNQAFKKSGLNWYWTKKEYEKLLNKSGGKDRISRYAKQKKIKVSAKKLSILKTKIFNNYLKKNELKEGLFIVDEISNNLSLASRNLPNVNVTNLNTLNPINLLKFNSVVIAENCLNLLKRNYREQYYSQ